MFIFKMYVNGYFCLCLSKKDFTYLILINFFYFMSFPITVHYVWSMSLFLCNIFVLHTQCVLRCSYEDDDDTENSLSNALRPRSTSSFFCFHV